MKSTIFIISLFILFSLSAFAGQYDGQWEGNLNWCKTDYKKFSGKYKLTIRDNYARMLRYDLSTADQIELYKGKVYGFTKKNKLGLNGRLGNVRGKFNSSNTIFLTFANNKKCRIKMMKINKSNQTATNKKLLYCKDKRGNVFSRDSRLYNSCAFMKEISYAEYKRGDQKSQVSISINQTATNKKLLYCKDKRGNVFSRDSRLYNSCAFMKEISYAEYKRGDQKKQVVQSTKKTIQPNVVTEQTFIIENDTTGPEITVNKSFQSNQDFTVTIKGRLRDASEIAVFTIAGYPVSVQNGSFSKQFFVKPSGQMVEIVSIDIHGNRTSSLVALERASVQIVTKQFDFLDPRKIKSKIDPNAVALIIGIEDYENTFTAPFAKNDALAFNDFAHTSFGVPQYNIKLLMNDDAERTDTLKTLTKWLPKVVRENKTDLYVFFSGHGLASENGEDLFLLPSDGDPELLEYSSLMRNQIFDQIAKLNPKSVTVFLDTCYSGSTRSDEFLVAAKPIFIEMQEQDIPYNFTVFSASSGRDTAKVLPEAEHGLFSYYLMKGLEGEADANRDKQITNGELHTFINNNVSRLANQTPQLSGDSNQVLVKW